MPDKQWSEMTPQEKRAERKRWWLEPEGVTFESPAAAQGYKERVQRARNKIATKTQNCLRCLFSLCMQWLQNRA